MPNVFPEKMKAEVKELNFYYDHLQALKNVNLPISDKKITALIGPSGCGKTTYLRCFNRMHDRFTQTTDTKGRLSSTPIS